TLGTPLQQILSFNPMPSDGSSPNYSTPEWSYPRPADLPITPSGGVPPVYVLLEKPVTANKLGPEVVEVLQSDTEIAFQQEFTPSNPGDSCPASTPQIAW